MIIKYHDLTESEVMSKSYEAGCMYCCSDTGNIFFDSVLDGSRIQLGRDVIICTSLPLAPVSNKLYCNISDGTINTYVDNGWVVFGGGGSSKQQIHFNNVVISDGVLNIQDSRIMATDSAVFTPDLSVADIAGTITVSIAAGSITVTSDSTYDIPGEVIVN